MADALRIRTLVSSKTLTLSDLDRFIGKRVEVIVIEDDGAPARPDRATQPRHFGSLAGKLHVADDFDAPLPEAVLRDFEGDDGK